MKRPAPVVSSSLMVQRADGSVLATLPVDEHLSDQMKGLLSRESRWRFLHNLDNSASQSKMSIEIRVVPVEVETTRPCGEVIRTVRDRPPGPQFGKLDLSECEYVALELKNNGSEEAYISIVDLQSNGTIAPLWPQPRHNVADNHRPNDGQWYRLPLPYIFEICEPLGPEIFKAIATTEPTDFGLVVDPVFTRGTPRKNEGNALRSPLGQLLRSLALGTRSGTASIDPSDWSTASVGFDVVDTGLGHCQLNNN